MPRLNISKTVTLATFLCLLLAANKPCYSLASKNISPSPTVLVEQLSFCAAGDKRGLRLSDSLVIADTKEFILQARSLHERGILRIMGQSTTPLQAGKPGTLFTAIGEEDLSTLPPTSPPKLLTEVVLNGEGAQTSYTLTIRVITPAVKETASAHVTNSRTAAVFIFRLKADETAVFSLTPETEESKDASEPAQSATNKTPRLFTAIRVRRFYEAPMRYA